MKLKSAHKFIAWVLSLAMLMTFVPSFMPSDYSLSVFATEGTGSDSDDSEFGEEGGDTDGGDTGSTGSKGGESGDGTAVPYLAPKYDSDGNVTFDKKQQRRF